MEPKWKIIAEGLSKAMEAEMHGQHFYKMAGQTTTDPRGKEVFARLAAEEKKHYEYLRQAYQTLEDGGELEARLGKPEAIGPEGIFSKDLESRIKDAHFEMSALSVGIQLELSAVHFYQELEMKTRDETVKSFFRELIRWEKEHYESLLSEYDELKEAYWQGAGFAPF